ncbi:MAG: hypothetical protein JWR05_342 [Mucilaginibacter sp.]|jgi:hypothetical protein|nr:hypothetical protein [Mucilaginibacter sp.]
MVLKIYGVMLKLKAIKALKQAQIQIAQKLNY